MPDTSALPPSSTPRQPFGAISELHRQLGHPVRLASNGQQAYCVVCMLLWSTHAAGGWYSTDLIEALSAA